MSAKISDPASIFEKALRAFQLRDLPYSDLQSYLQGLLATGSPDELMKVLHRREQIEPLPDYAHKEVLRLITEAGESHHQADFGFQTYKRVVVPPGVAATAAQEPEAANGSGATKISQTDALVGDEHSSRGTSEYIALHSAYERTREEASAAMRRVTSLEREVTSVRNELEAERHQTRGIENKLSERASAGEAAQSLALVARRDAQRLQEELRAAQESLSSRDATIASLQHEHANLMPAFDRRSKLSAQLETDLQISRARAATLAEELSAVQSALVSARARSQESAAALTEKIAASDAEVLRTNAEAQRSAQAVVTLEKRVSVLEQEAAAARTRYDATVTELASSREALATLKAHRERDLAALGSVRAELEAVQRQSNSYLELLRSREWRRNNLPNEAQAIAPNENPAAESLRQPVQIPPEKLRTEFVELKTAPQPFSEAGRVAELLEGRPRRIEPKTVPVAPAPSVRADSADWKPRINARSIRVGALALLLALIAWSIAHRRPAQAIAPALAPVVAAAGTLIHDCATCPEMTVLPPGKFNQGLDAAANATAFEMPVHAVTIGHPLAMSTNDVTVEEFRAFVAATGRKVQGCETYDGAWAQRADANWENPGFAQTGAHPVTCVSWADANAYADWLTAKAGHRYRLPSASEWEYAARAGGVAVQPWSSLSDACGQANVADQSAARRYPGWSAFSCDDGAIYTTAVGSFSANAFGLKDMLGNVLQWTQDCWYTNYQGAPVDGSPRTAADCAQRELRGASWFTAPGIARASYRNHFGPDYRTSSVGIRLVRDVQS